MTTQYIRYPNPNQGLTGYLKADGSVALTANWNAGAFSITANSVVLGSAANTISALSTIINTGTLTLPISTDTLVGRATTDTLTNKSISGSANTLTNIGDTSLTTSYLKADGSRALTASWAAGAFSITANSVVLGSAANTISALSTIVNTGTLTLPTATDTLVARATTDTLTNKTISGGSNTLSSIADGSLSTSYVKADGSRPLTANWGAGAFSITANSVAVGSSANAISGLTTLTQSGTAGIAIDGTATNNSAAAGKIGELIDSLSGAGAYTNAATTTAWADATSISLTAGDWDLSAYMEINRNSATPDANARFSFGISTTTGNSAAGLTQGQNQSFQSFNSASTQSSGSIPRYRVSLSATTTHYLKIRVDYSAGTPQYLGYISARRMR